jgi:hypothetical protein
MSGFLDHFDDEAPSPQQGGASKLSKVHDGPVKFRIDTVEQRKGSRSVPGGAKEHGAIITVNFTVLGGEQDGVEASNEWWVLNKQDRDRYSGDLQVLGFDPENWSPANNRPFSKEVDKAHKLLPGLIVAAEKNSKTGDNNKVTHFLNVKGRAMNGDGKPEDGKPLKFTPEDMNEAVADAFA